MSVYPILFEDSSLGNFRPLAWSTPVYELRCGILNTRERAGLNCLDHAGQAGRALGGLLCRPFLEPLHAAKGWTVGCEAIGRELGQVTGKVLWLNGRVGPDTALVGELLAWARKSKSNFTWTDEHGLLAACLDSTQARALLESWVQWEQTAAKTGCWHLSDCSLPSWDTTGLLAAEGEVLQVGSSRFQCASEIPAELQDLEAGKLGFIWDLVTATAQAIEGDLSFIRDLGPWYREPFGLTPSAAAQPPVWEQASHLQVAPDCLPVQTLQTCHLTDPARFWVAADVTLAPGTAINTDKGPVILDRGVQVMPHVFLEGPLYVGPGSIIKAGACLYGESSYGIGNRLAGEIGESTFGDFSNKQHDGFIGHAVLGAWINLGAMTTCSDLKNNYGPVRVDLGLGEVDSGRRFVGLLLGDHVKTAIGSLFNTGTCVGFGTNIFGGGMPPKFVGNFKWGGQPGCPDYAVDKAVETAAVVMPRRGCQLSEAHRTLFQRLGGR